LQTATHAFAKYFLSFLKVCTNRLVNIGAMKRKKKLVFISVPSASDPCLWLNKVKKNKNKILMCSLAPAQVLACRFG
jgi:hypothetical protein